MKYTHILSRFLHIHFLEIWLGTLLFVIVCSLVQLAGSKRNLTTALPNQNSSLLQHISGSLRLDRLPLGMFCIFVCTYIALILYQEDFGYYDETLFIFSSLKGEDFDPPIWIVFGRFWPLGRLEFNFIRILTQSPEGYHIFPILQLVMLLILLFLILKDFSTHFRIFVCVLILTTPTFVVSFFGLVYPERNMLFGLVIFLVCAKYFYQTKSRYYLCAALVATQFTLYYKEPVCFLLGGFALFRIILGINTKVTQPDTSIVDSPMKQYRLEAGVLLLVAVFILFYLGIFFPHLNLNYAQLRASGTLGTILAYLKFDLLLDIFLLVLFARIYFALRKSVAWDLFWDPLAIGALLYFASFVKLQLFNIHYMAPVDLVAILYLARWVVPFFRQKRQRLSALVIALTLLVFSRNLAYSAFHVVERKNMIAAKVQVSEFLQQFTKFQNYSTTTVFFPFSDSTGYSVMEWAAFLEYKGLKFSTNQTDRNGVQFILKRPFAGQNDDRCISYVESIKCFYSSGPEKGDLVVILSDDLIPPDEIKRLEQDAVLLFHYKPFLAFTNHLLPFFCYESVPDNWLQMLVIRKL